MNDIVRRLENTTQDAMKITVKDCHEALVSIGGRLRSEPFWLSTDKLVVDIEGKYYRPYIEKHHNFRLQVRRSVRARLQIAQDGLPKHWQLVIKAGFRPLEVQRAMFDDFLKLVRKQHADWSRKACEEYAGQYIIDPRLGAAPHTTGGAVDVDIYDTQSKQLVDMGCRVCEVGVASHLLNEGLSAQQRENQETLLRVMLSAGFAPLYSEWWHFSYGDQRWAAFYGKTQAIYGATEQEPGTITDNDTKE